MANKLKGIFLKYKKYIFISFAIFIILTILLIFFSSGPQGQAFIYQVF